MSGSDSNRLTGRDWLWLGLICSFGLGSVAIQMAWVLALFGGYLFWRKGAVVIDPSLRQMWFLAGLPSSTRLYVHFRQCLNGSLGPNAVAYAVLWARGRVVNTETA